VIFCCQVRYLFLVRIGPRALSHSKSGGTIERKELIQRRLQQRPRKPDLSCHWLVTGVSSDKR
jgi:hypothetical protein